MAQSDEVLEPYEGQKFTSFDALKKYLEEYGQKNFVKFWIRSSHTRNSLKSRISKTMNPDLKYVSVKFACIFGGEKIRCRGSGIRKSSTYRNLGCPCTISAVVGEDGNHVKLDTVMLEHNHLLCKTLYDTLKKTKRKKNKKLGGSFKENENLELYGEKNSFSSATEEVNCLNEIVGSGEGEINDYDDDKVNKKTVNLTENSLESIKDKYGNNIKILVINSESNELNVNLKNFKVDESFNCVNKKGEINGDICRLCLSSKEKLSPIFDPNLPLKSTVLSFKIMGCASIEISSDDGLPNNICTVCEANLDIAYNFRIRCENSDSILRRSFLKNDNGDENLNSQDNKFVDVIETSEVQNALVSYQDGLEGTEGLVEENDIPFRVSSNIRFDVVCPVCGLGFESCESMLDHLGAHSDHEASLLACNFCNMIWSTVKALKEHMKQHLKELKTEALGSVQNETTHLIEEQQEIFKDFHNETKKRSPHYLCNVCGKTLRSKERFQAHKNTHEGLRPHICLKCGKGFADRKNMYEHYDVVHLRMTKHECPVCQKKFYTRTKMKSHLTMHFGIKPFTCDICNKTFRLKMNMLKHKKTHSGDRPYQCDKCSAAFVDKNILQRHSYIHGGIRPYPCPVCGHRFSVNSHLKKHLEKTKCRGGSIEDFMNLQWKVMSHQDSNISQNECAMETRTGENILQSETVNVGILEEYCESANP